MNYYQKYLKYKQKYLNTKGGNAYDCDSHNLAKYVRVPPIAFTMGYSDTTLLCKFINNKRNNINNYEINEQYREYVCDKYKALNNEIKLSDKYANILPALNTFIENLDPENSQYVKIITGLFLISLFLDHIDKKGLDYPIYTSLVSDKILSNKDILSLIISINEINIIDIIVQLHDAILYHKQDRFIVVPHISSSGIFGLNSFLHMYFNHMAPIGIPITKAPSAHVDTLETRLTGTMHDYQHFVNRYINIKENDMTYYNNIYDNIFNNFKKQPFVNNYKIIALLFFLINEIGHVPSTDDNAKTNLIKKIDERFGPYNFQDIEAFVPEPELVKLYAIEMADLIPLFEKTLKYGNDAEYDITNFRNYGPYLNKHFKEILKLFEAFYA